MADSTSIFTLLKRAVKDFMDDNCPRLAAALSYYTIFALPSLLVLLLALIGTVWDARSITSQFSRVLSAQAAQEIQSILANADRPGSGGVIPTIAGIVGLVFGATGAFIQLQAALNRAWEVAPDPDQGGVMSFLAKRMFSFLIVLGVGVLLVASMLLSSVLTAFGGALGALLPGPLSSVFLWIVDIGVSLAVAVLLFAVVFKVIPDAKIAWSDVWAGAALTAVLFVIAKFGMGIYLGMSNPGQAFGAAGSLAVLMLWVYVSGLLLLFGAEFTQRWAEAKGSGVVPEEGAVRMVVQTGPAKTAA